MRHRAVAAEQQSDRARANETILRQQAEAREKVTQAALLISQGRFADADTLAEQINFNKPTVEGAALLRALGEWHALNGRWQLAVGRFSQLLRINGLDVKETVSMDFLGCATALASVHDAAQYELFRNELARRLADEPDPAVAQRMLKAILLLPAETNVLASLPATWPAFGSTPQKLASIGNPPVAAGKADGHEDIYASRLKLQNVGTRQPCSMKIESDQVSIVAGGADIWGGRDEFAYAFLPATGDFDYRLRVHSIGPELDGFTRVGLMARESPEQTDSRHVMVAVNATNTFQVLTRAEAGGWATSVPQNPLPAAYGSNAWVRLQRVGAVFHAYTSSNGVDWAQLYQTTGGDKPFSDPIYLGIAASAHSSNSVATFVVSDFGATPAISADAAVALALIEYRRGHFVKAGEWCLRLLAYPECNAVQTATAQVIQAMIDARLNQMDDASRELTPAHDVVEKKFALGLEPGNKMNGFWFDWVFARVLLQEAAALIQ
jgi:hypothetical protein